MVKRKRYKKNSADVLSCWHEVTNPHSSSFNKNSGGLTILLNCLDSLQSAVIAWSSRGIIIILINTTEAGWALQIDYCGQKWEWDAAAKVNIVDRRLLGIWTNSMKIDLTTFWSVAWPSPWHIWIVKSRHAMIGYELKVDHSQMPTLLTVRDVSRALKPKSYSAVERLYILQGLVIVFLWWTYNNLPKPALHPLWVQEWTQRATAQSRPNLKITDWCKRRQHCMKSREDVTNTKNDALTS